MRVSVCVVHASVVVCGRMLLVSFPLLCAVPPPPPSSSSLPRIAQRWIICWWILLAVAVPSANHSHHFVHGVCVRRTCLSTGVLCWRFGATTWIFSVLFFFSDRLAGSAQCECVFVWWIASFSVSEYLYLVSAFDGLRVHSATVIEFSADLTAK